MNKYDGITVIRGQKSISFLFDNDISLSETGLKALSAQRKDYLMTYYITRLNGKTKIIYLTQGLIPLNQIINKYDEVKLASILLSLVEILKDISSVGYLREDCVDLNEQHIYIDSKNEKIYVVYLPLSSNMIGNMHIGVNSELLKLIAKEIAPSGNIPFSLRPVANYISNVNVNYDQLIILLRDAVWKGRIISNSNRNNAQRKNNVSEIPNINNINMGYWLVPIGEVAGSAVKVTMPVSVVGRSRKKVNIYVPYSKTISRIHCRLYINNGKLSVEDLNSTYHTYVNNIEVKPGNIVTIEEGDTLRLGDVNFNVVRIRRK